MLNTTNLALLAGYLNPARVAARYTALRTRPRTARAWRAIAIRLRSAAAVASEEGGELVAMTLREHAADAQWRSKHMARDAN